MAKFDKLTTGHQANILSEPSVPWLSRLEEELVRRFQKDWNNNRVQVEIVNIIKRPFSTIVFAAVKTQDKEIKLVAKNLVWHPVNYIAMQEGNPAEVEFEALSKLYPLFAKTESCRIPRPLFVIPELELFVMDFIPGNMFSDYFEYARYFSSTAGLKQLVDYCRLCGIWLRHLHQFSGITYEDVHSLDQMFERFNNRLRLIEEIHDSRIPSGFSPRVSEFIAGLRDRLSREKLPTAGRQGDFGHWNMIVAGSQITVIDFMGYRREPVPYDLLKMVLSIRSWKYHPFYSTRMIEKMISAFLSGYGNLPSISDSLLHLCEAHHHASIIYAGLTNPGRSWHQRKKTEGSLNASITDLRHLYSHPLSNHNHILLNSIKQ